MGGVGEVGPEHQPLQGVGCPTPGNPAEGRLVRARRLHPGHARRSEGSSPGKEKGEGEDGEWGRMEEEEKRGVGWRKGKWK